jgi:hypothetical protein
VPPSQADPKVSRPWGPSADPIDSRTQFADLNTDGKAELIYLYPDGNTRAWPNTGGLANFLYLNPDIALATGLPE